MMTIHQCMCLRVRENEYALFKLLLCVLFYIKYCNYSFNNIVFKHYIYLDYALFACIYVHANKVANRERGREREGGRFVIQTISVHILPPCGDLNATLMRIQVIIMS